MNWLLIFWIYTSPGYTAPTTIRVSSQELCEQARLKLTDHDSTVYASCIQVSGEVERSGITIYLDYDDPKSSGGRVGSDRQSK